MLNENSCELPKLTFILSSKNFRLETLSQIIPRNLSTIAKQLFQTAFCVKPRIIQGALNIFSPRNRSITAVQEMETLITTSKTIYYSSLAKYIINLVKSIIDITTESTFYISYLGRTPRFLRRKIKGVLSQVEQGAEKIWRTYLNQVLENWRDNYEFVYNNLFARILELANLKNKRKSK